MKNTTYGWIFLVLIGIATSSVIAVLANPVIAADEAARSYYAVLTVLGIFFMMVAAHFAFEWTPMPPKKRRR